MKRVCLFVVVVVVAAFFSLPPLPPPPPLSGNSGVANAENIEYPVNTRVQPRTRAEIYRQRVEWERSPDTQLQRFEAVYDEVCRGSWGGVGVTCHLYDHELTNGNTATTLVITCNDNYDCDLDIDNRENTAEFTPTYTDDDPYTQATITPRRAPNPVRTVSVSHRTITVDGEPYDAQYINGRVNTYLTQVYEPTTISYRAPDGTTAYVEYTKSDGTTTTKVCTFINKVDPDTGDIISRFTEPVFPDADGLCRDETSVDESISVLGAFSTTPGREYDFKSAEGKDEDGNPYVRGSLREVTSPAPPDPVPIPGCFDTEERTVRSHPRGPSETVTAITGYSRCSEAEYYRYLDAAEQQTVDQYEAEERYVEEIAELDRQDRPFWICISREEWEEMNGVGPRCQLANPPGHQTFS